MTTLLDSAARPLDEASIDQLFRDAHTAYSFTSEGVSDAQLTELYDLVRHAPTALNSQPLRITFIRSDEAKARLLPHLAEMNRAKAQSAPVVAILTADTNFHENLDRTAPHMDNAKAKFADDAARAQTAITQGYLQAGYFIVAVRALGLDAGPMGGFDREGIDAEFLGGTAQKSFLVVNIGHVSADGNRPRQFRLECEEAVTIL